MQHSGQSLTTGEMDGEIKPSLEVDDQPVSIHVDVLDVGVGAPGSPQHSEFKGMIVQRGPSASHGGLA